MKPADTMRRRTSPTMSVTEQNSSSRDRSTWLNRWVGTLLVLLLRPRGGSNLLHNTLAGRTGESLHKYGGWLWAFCQIAGCPKELELLLRSYSHGRTRFKADSNLACMDMSVELVHPICGANCFVTPEVGRDLDAPLARDRINPIIGVVVGLDRSCRGISRAWSPGCGGFSVEKQRAFLNNVHSLRK